MTMFKKLIFIFIFLISLIAIRLEIKYIPNSTFFIEKEITKIKEETNTIDKSLSLPNIFNLDVPFVLQAPGGDWSYPFCHACEEASVLMVHYFLTGKKDIQMDLIKSDLRNIISFEDKNYGYNEDTNMYQTERFVKDYFGYKTILKYDISLEDIKKELVLGSPVIIPVAGRLLNNPYFKSPGPVYHLILVKGYNENGFICHDPGTIHGENIVYSYEIIENAIHDMVVGEDMKKGKSSMLFFKL